MELPPDIVVQGSASPAETMPGSDETPPDDEPPGSEPPPKRGGHLRIVK
jgi:hypothetical protein